VTYLPIYILQEARCRGENVNYLISSYPRLHPRGFQRVMS